MIRFLLFGGGIVLLAWGGLWLFLGGAEDRAAIDRHEAYRIEAEALRENVQAGHVEAAFALARMVRNGLGVERDLKEAARLYTEAARAGHLGAILVLGALYESGKGVRQSYHRAAEWYALAERLGQGAEAEFALGQLYFYGRGVIHDYGEALSWYRKAARRGHPVAQYVLGGAMYAEGWGLKQDLVEVYKWYTLALADIAAVKAVSAKFDPEMARKVVAAKMNRSQIKKAEQQAAMWRPGDR
jgi:TPR repeat protein